MVVGFMNGSESDMTGISTGKPPCCQTPRLISLARSRKWVWQVLRSFQVLRIPMMGLFS